MADAYIVAGARTAVGKAPRGMLRATRPDDMGAAVVRDLLGRLPRVAPDAIDDLIIGCAMPEFEAGTNVARIVGLRAGLPDSVPGVTVNRFCASGAQTIAMAAERILAGGADLVVAGGVESMSMTRGSGTFAANPALVAERPSVYLSMGLTAERVAERYRISREDADAFALRSHERALAAQRAGRFADDGIVPLDVESVQVAPDGRRHRTRVRFEVDEGPRADTSAEALAKLRPAFHVAGTVTAGNASQTSDGAAAVVMASADRARELGLTPMARFVTFAVSGVAPEEMGIGPVLAIPKALKRAGLTLGDIDLIELNEAFAAQALAVIREAGLDADRVNVNGGAIALGHPLGATGAKLVVQLLGELRRRQGRYGMVTMCVGGGQGAALILENLQ
ncbi:MAG: acetyl-CoA C-acyltransferase [Vicinamibacterales bacterium]